MKEIFILGTFFFILLSLPLSPFLICPDYIMKLYILVCTTNPSFHPIQKQDTKIVFIRCGKIYIQDRSGDCEACWNCYSNYLSPLESIAFMTTQLLLLYIIMPFYLRSTYFFLLHHQQSLGNRRWRKKNLYYLLYLYCF